MAKATVVAGTSGKVQMVVRTSVARRELAKKEEEGSVLATGRERDRRGTLLEKVDLTSENRC